MKKNTGEARVGDDRVYNKANNLAVFAIVVFAISYTIIFSREGFSSKIWVVFAGSLISIFTILLLRKARGILNPAFTIPFFIYLVFTAGSYVSGRFTGFFTVYFCICGLAMMYWNPWRYFLFFTFSNIITLVLIFIGIPMAKNFAGQIADWMFTVIGSLFLFMAIQVISEKSRKSVRAEDSFATLLSSTPDYIVLVDEKYRVSYISKTLAEFAHIEDPKMTIGRPLLDIFGDMDVKLKAAEILDSHGLYEGTWELPIDGESRYFRIISNRLLGESAGVFISLTDITSLVKARYEAEAADRAKSTFIANTSHEIRTPMNAILGMAEIILRKDISADVHEDVKSIKQAGTNLVSIINDMLDFSKIESGKLEIIPAQYRFSSLIDDVLNIIRMRLAEKQLDFTVNINNSLPAVLIGDEIRVRQVLLNLLSNAVKYTKEGEISLKIFSMEIKAEQNADIVLVFEISDTGIGIQKENLNKIFGEFEQFDTRSNRGVEGTGLGLAISRNLCRLMGGDITVESVYGEGSVFRAIIPQQIKDASPFADEELYIAREGLASFTAPEARLLVVDDIATNLKVAEGLLKPYQATVETCLNGKDAIEMVKKNKYDIIFMDHMMPEMDGIETTAVIRTWEKKQKKEFTENNSMEFSQKTPKQSEACGLPIVALTANAVSGMREMFLENGFNDFLSKPIEIIKLDEIMGKWIPAQMRQAKINQSIKQETINVKLEIPGVDVKQGIIMTGGNLQGYLQVLSLFCKDAAERLPMLNNFIEEKSPNYKTFTTQVHALKSASGILGAAEISKEAAELEAAGEAADLDLIKQKLKDFTDRLTELVEAISQKLTEISLNDIVETASGTTSAADLLPLLNNLKEALTAQKSDIIDSILEKINHQALDSKTRKKIEMISFQVLKAEFDEALVSLGELI